MKLSLYVLALLFVSLFFMCGEDPDIVFPQKEYKGTIFGYVELWGVKAKVYLFESKVIDSIVPSQENGYFAFKNIPYGNYQLRIISDSFAVYTQYIECMSEFISVGKKITLSKKPSFILNIFPEENSAIDMNSHFFTDTSFVAYVKCNQKIPEKLFNSNFKISPQIVTSINCQDDPYYDSIFLISIPLYSFFQQPAITLTLDSRLWTAFKDSSNPGYTFTYHPDTSSKHEASRRYFFKAPSLSSDIKNNNYAMFYFKKPMNHAVTEKSIRISPDFDPAFSWNSTSSEDVLLISFKQPLPHNSSITVSFDTTMMTADSVRPYTPITFTLQTPYLQITSSYPTFICDILNPTLRYTFNFPIDSQTFCKAYSITPQIDSLSFTFLNNYKAVAITGSTLKDLTGYQIMIDTSLIATTGERMNVPYKHSFHVFTATGIKNYISSITPSDTTTYQPCSSEIQITFSTSMNKQSVEKHLSITPEILANYSWNGSRLTIEPLQLLKSNTLFTLTLDSGFTTSNNQICQPFKSFFKTNSLQLISCTPVNDQINVAPETEIKLKFNTEIDTFSLLKNVNISPTVDSLSLKKLDSYIYIKHAPFKVNTFYTFTIRGSLCDRYGVPSGKEYRISFKTVE